MVSSQPWYDQRGIEFNGGNISKTALAQKVDASTLCENPASDSRTQMVFLTDSIF